MKKRGHDYADHMSAINDPAFGAEEPTPHEIAVATADVACKEEVDLIDTYVAATIAYQERVIDANSEALRSLKELLTVRQENVTAMLASKSFCRDHEYIFGLTCRLAAGRRLRQPVRHVVWRLLLAISGGWVAGVVAGPYRRT